VIKTVGVGDGVGVEVGSGVAEGVGVCVGVGVEGDSLATACPSADTADGSEEFDVLF